MTVVLMGVSGVGKSSVAAELVAATGWAFLEGDELHPALSRERMSAGQPLDDAYRFPWLRALAEWIGEREAAGQDAVLTCSALRRSYRDTLRAGHPSVRFIHLAAPEAEIQRRLLGRRDHFMPASLLASQFATLELLQPDEPGTTVAADGEPSQLSDAILGLLADDDAS